MIHRVTLYRDKRTEIYWFNYQGLDGKRKRESTGTKNRKEAETLRNARAGELFKAQALGLKDVNRLKAVTFKDFVEGEFLEYCKPPTLKDGTYKGYVELGKKVMPHFGTMYLAQVTAGDVQRYLDSLKSSGFKRGKKEFSYSPARINRYRSFLSGIFTEAKRRGYVDQNPASSSRKLEEDNIRVRCLSDVEETKLTTLCEDWLRPIIRFALATGMRRGEILGLTWDDIDRDTRRIRVQHTKTKRTRYVRLRKAAEAALEDVPQMTRDGRLIPWIFASSVTGEPYTRWEVRHGFERAVRRAGVKDVRMHDLRHTLATRLYRETKDLQAVQKVLGHSIITTTTRYAHVFQTDADSAMDALDSVDRSTDISGVPVNTPSNQSVSTRSAKQPVEVAG